MRKVDETVEAVLCSASLSEAARALGVARSTLYRRLQREPYREALAQARQLMQQHAQLYLLQRVRQAIDTLAALLEHSDARVQLAAAKALLDAFERLDGATARAREEPIVIVP
ncbi:MAG: hypothetical protein N2554_01125, partial [Fimbriimonadales bacterium]|nr:hypothetical protein [Fimbriimonadales bacterium]